MIPNNPRFISLYGANEYQDTASPEFTLFTQWRSHYEQKEDCGCYVFAQKEAVLSYKNDSVKVQLQSGQFASITGAFTLTGGTGIIIKMKQCRPMFMMGGPIEERGRLKYIDGCTDSLLLSPTKCGNPCFNALYFPPSINQTTHTHPSLRVGLVVSGQGECITPEKVIPLEAGLAFVIETDGVHSFRTFDDSGMVVVAYHPDSDFGPRDEDHPMINRTIVGGVAASMIDEIRTK